MFGALDFSVFIGYFVVVLALGFLVGRSGGASVNRYFRADNRLPWYVIGFSIVAASISSEQFVGEVGYAYSLGMPVANWDWLVAPSLTLMIWIFVPLYIRSGITTMPEYLENRFGGSVRTLYAWISVASYVVVNFALVFYTGGFALEKMWSNLFSIDKVSWVWVLAIATGAYTIYGGLAAVAWTGTLQCVLLLGGGIYVFLAAMSRIDWDFPAILGTGQQAHLIAPVGHDVSWPAMVILAISTNFWYYASNQYINQRSLAARNEWHAKMGVLFAGFLQLLMPLATCFPGMAYRVINPSLADSNAAYPAVVSEVVPIGLRGLVAAAIIAAIMSTISGLVNSISTIATLDLFGRSRRGRGLTDAQLVRFGRWAGAAAVLIGALLAPVVMKWENIFRYAQDIWAPLASPVAVVFLAAALWDKATERGALACLWLAVLTVPLTFAKQFCADYNVHFLPANLENSMVFAGVIFLASAALIFSFPPGRSWGQGLMRAGAAAIPIALIGTYSQAWTGALVGLTATLGVAVLMLRKRAACAGRWDRSMLRLPGGTRISWYRQVWFWWGIFALCSAAIYYWFW